MKEFKLIIKPTDEPEEIEQAEKFLEEMGFEVEKIEEVRGE